MKTPNTFLSQTFRNCLLLLLDPIDFLLTFTDPVEKIPPLKAVSDVAHNAGQKFLKEIKGHMSGGMQAYFTGSNFFKVVAINNDLDFLAEYSTESEKKKWKKILIKYLGKPVVDNNRFSKWESLYGGFQVEVLLSNAKSRMFRNALNSYFVFCRHPELVAEYDKLKRDSAGVSVREYNRRQIYFFEFHIRNKMSQGKNDFILRAGN